MKFSKSSIVLTGLILTVFISNMMTFFRDGMKLDELRNSVIRLHILANSDSETDQLLKIKVRDALLDADIFEKSESMEEAEKKLSEKLAEIEKISEMVLHENGCDLSVKAEIEDVFFDERVYDDITMPSGMYRALRVKIGSAKGHNWWCVMYPPLCVPCACEVETDEEKTDEYFDEEEKDILYKPQKYRIRFAVWDEMKKLKSKYNSFVHNNEKAINA